MIGRIAFVLLSIMALITFIVMLFEPKIEFLIIWVILWLINFILLYRDAKAHKDIS